MDHYTYIHRKADDGKVFYVGKGTRPDRMKMRAGRSVRWSRTVAKHGFIPELVAKWPTAEDAFTHERFLIACFRDMGADLVKHTDGGEGAPGYLQSDATKQKRNDKLRGMKRPTETIERMKAAQAGKSIAQETRKKIANTLLGRYSGAANPNAKPVVCIETGQHFDTMQDAANWLREQGNGKATFKSVHAAVSGTKKTAYGYQWRRA